MSQTYAQRFQQEITRFFDDNFPRKFHLFEPMSANVNFAYYCNFPSVGVSIVIFLPLYKNNNDELEIANKRQIQIVLKYTHNQDVPFLIELTNVQISKLWRDRLKERVGILWELVNEQTLKCAECSIYMIPKVRRTHKDKKRTKFVTLQCPICHKYKSTEYGMGFKTILHRNLKKKRIK